MYRKYYKRIFDILFSILGAIILLPLFIGIVLISLFRFKGNVFFLQKRIGYHQRVFIIYKFRTMSDLKDEKGKLLSDDKRVNSYGLFLRKFSLDEIPQILNILKGDISIVGPRPLLIEYLDYFTPAEQLRHTIKPGLTGLAQVKGRNEINWINRFEYDVYYVHHQSWLLDIKIFTLTFLKIFQGQHLHFSSSLIEERKNKKIPYV